MSSKNIHSAPIDLNAPYEGVFYLKSAWNRLKALDPEFGKIYLNAALYHDAIIVLIFASFFFQAGHSFVITVPCLLMIRCILKNTLCRVYEAIHVDNWKYSEQKDSRSLKKMGIGFGIFLGVMKILIPAFTVVFGMGLASFVGRDSNRKYFIAIGAVCDCLKISLLWVVLHDLITGENSFQFHLDGGYFYLVFLAFILHGINQYTALGIEYNQHLDEE